MHNCWFGKNNLLKWRSNMVWVLTWVSSMCTTKSVVWHGSQTGKKPTFRANRHPETIVFMYEFKKLVKQDNWFFYVIGILYTMSHEVKIVKHSCMVRRMTLYHIIHEIHAEYIFREFLKDDNCDWRKKRMNEFIKTQYLVIVQLVIDVCFRQDS